MANTRQLGRRPSPPDDRDYKMRSVLDAAAAPSALDLALASVVKSHIVPGAVKRWAKLVTAAIEAPVPSPPPPGPTPSPTPTPATENPWRDADQLDQGNTPHCVGFGWAQYGNTDPVNDNFADADGHAIYYECKVIDGEPKAEDGSNVRSGAQAMRARGRIDAFVFAESLADIREWVRTRGPVVIGSDWTNDMFEPDIDAFVTPTGTVAGGHCYLLVGYGDDGVLTFQNSWGAAWGDNGYFRMHEQDFAKLLSAQGEACAAVELASAAPAV